MKETASASSSGKQKPPCCSGNAEWPSFLDSGGVGLIEATQNLVPATGQHPSIHGPHPPQCRRYRSRCSPTASLLFSKTNYLSSFSSSSPPGVFVLQTSSLLHSILHRWHVSAPARRRLFCDPKPPPLPAFTKKLPAIMGSDM